MWVYRKGEISHSSAASKTYSCYTRTACQLERAYIFSALEEKEQSMSCQQKEERQKKYRQSDGSILLKKVGNATGGKGATYGDI